MYYLLTMSPVPSLIASFEDATAGHDSGDDEAAATNLIARAASDLPEALLRAAQLPDALLTGAEPLPPPANPLPGLLKPLVDWQRSHRSLDSRTRARYCAAYDFFFQPQAAFQAALDQLGTED